MPLGVVNYSEENARPFGICAAARKGQEGLLLRKSAILPSQFIASCPC